MLPLNPEALNLIAGAPRPSTMKNGCTDNKHLSGLNCAPAHLCTQASPARSASSASDAPVSQHHRCFPWLASDPSRSRWHRLRDCAFYAFAVLAIKKPLENLGQTDIFNFIYWWGCCYWCVHHLLLSLTFQANANSVAKGNAATTTCAKPENRSHFPCSSRIESTPPGPSKETLLGLWLA